MPASALPTHHYDHTEPFPLARGGTLPGFRLAYETWGDPNSEQVVVVLHALSGSSHAFSSAVDESPGWWQRLLADGGPIDPTRQYIICANLIGGCFGSTGPSSIDITKTPSGTTGDEVRRYATRFPTITISDMVDAYRALLRHLEVQRPVTLLGGSMGGMLALEWSVRHPEDVEFAISLVAPGRSYAATIAIRSVQRRAILNDPHYQDGDYYDGMRPETGIALARQIGVITYRSPAEFEARFGRQERDARPHFRDGFFEVESYLRHQGEKFRARFDANTYLYYSRAMDLYDLSNGYGSMAEALSRVTARTLLIAVDSDTLCPVEQVEEVERGLTASGKDVQFRVLHSLYGHDAFLLEDAQIRQCIAERLG